MSLHHLCSSKRAWNWAGQRGAFVDGAGPPPRGCRGLATHLSDRHPPPPLCSRDLQVWRVGIMGYNCTPASIELVLAAFRDGLQKQGWVKK